MRISTAALVAAFACLPVSVGAQDLTAAETMQRMAEQDALLAQFDSLYRLSEELTFWQGVAIMGTQYDWKLAYSMEGGEGFRWTIKLYNALGDMENEAIAARQAIARSKVATEAQKAAGEALFARHLEMRAVAEEVLQLTRSGQAEEAADAFGSVTVPLRREIANAIYSVQREIRSEIASTALKARIAKP